MLVMLSIILTMLKFDSTLGLKLKFISLKFYTLVFALKLKFSFIKILHFCFAAYVNGTAAIGFY